MSSTHFAGFSLVRSAILRYVALEYGKILLSEIFRVDIAIDQSRDIANDLTSNGYELKNEFLYH